MTGRILGVLAGVAFFVGCGGSTPVAPSAPAPSAPPPNPPAQIAGSWSGSIQYSKVDFDAPDLKTTVKTQIALSLTQDGGDVTGSFKLTDGSAGALRGIVSPDHFEGSLSMVLNRRPDCPYNGRFSGSVSAMDLQWTGTFSTICGPFSGLGEVRITASHQ